MPRLRFVQLNAALPAISTADMLLCRRGRRFSGRLLSAAGRSPYVHAGMVLQSDDGPFIVDVLQFKGGRKVPLCDEIAMHPGRYDVFRIDDRRFPELNREAVAERMLQFATGAYGWFNVLRVGLRHLAFIRLAIPPLVDDQANGTYPPFCSQAMATAYRYGGVDPVPNLADRVTEPGDLARSLLFNYAFSLTV